MARYLPAGIGLVLIVVSALVQGKWSERWAKFPELDLYAEQLQNVPTDIGDWHSEPTAEPDERKRQAAGAVGTLSRHYTKEGGGAVDMFLVTGRLQDMFYHDPKRCYTASGFEMQDESRRYDVSLADGETAKFFYSTFVKTDPTGKEALVVYWSWDGSGKWEAPSNYKLTFRGQHAVYKLYLIYTQVSGNTPDNNPVTEFAPLLIPELDKAFEKATSEAQKLSEQS